MFSFQIPYIPALIRDISMFIDLRQTVRLATRDTYARVAASRQSNYFKPAIPVISEE